VWQERRLRFTYQRGGGCDSVERLADPLGLVAKGSAWYLVAAVGGEIRSYRVSRVVEAELTDDPCIRPDDFDLAGYWEQSTVNFKGATSPVHRDREGAPGCLPATAFRRKVRSDRASGGSGCRRMDTSNIALRCGEMAIEWALSFGSKIEVLEPATLREKVIGAAESVLVFYAER